MEGDIERRKCSVLGAGNWRTIPWRNRHKDRVQRLFDFGFDLAKLLEQLDLVNDFEALTSCIRSYDNLRTALEKWYHDQWVERAVHCNKSLGSGKPVATVEGAGSDDSDFQDLEEATSMLYYWLFQLVLYETLIILQRRIPQLSAVSGRESLLPATSLGMRLVNQTDDFGRAAAVNIVRASPYFLKDNTGWLGPQRAFLPVSLLTTEILCCVVT